MSETWAYPDGPVAIGAPRDRPLDPELPVIDASDVAEDRTIRAQVVIVGSGAGGAVVAAGLASAGIDTVVLEQGRKFERRDFHRAPLSGLLEMYEGGGLTVTIGTPGIALPYGRAVGGTTIINSGTCFRLPARVHARWVKDGLAELAEDALSSYYARVEARIHVGPVAPALAGGNADVVRRGAEKLGLSGGYLSRNALGCAGSGRCVFGCPSGAKQSMERSYLPDAVARGARIYARAKVERILLERDRAVGVVARMARTGGGHGRELVIRADHVVLAAGAIGTPLLLLRNRLGGPAAGMHLHIHPAAKTYAQMDEPIAGPGVPQSYYVDALHEDGVMLEGAYVPPELSAAAIPHFGARHSHVMNSADRLAMFGIMVTDSSEGRVRVGLGDGPLIRYDLNKRDAVAFKKGILLCARLFLAAGARSVFPALPGFETIEREADLRRLEDTEIRPRDLELVAFHPMGTCRIGLDPERSVVKPHLDVHGVSGLSIADGSVIPSSIGVNPQLTIMALAERLADRLVAELRA